MGLFDVLTLLMKPYMNLGSFKSQWQGSRGPLGVCRDPFKVLKVVKKVGKKKKVWEDLVVNDKVLEVR